MCLGRKTASFIFAAESNFDAICFKSCELQISGKEVQEQQILSARHERGGK